MATEKTTPTYDETASFVRNDAYYHARDAISHMRLFETQGDTFIIAKGLLYSEIRITRHPDGTLHMSGPQDPLRIQHYPTRKTRTVFQNTWDSIYAVARNALTDRVQEALGDEESTPTTHDLDKIYNAATKGARSTLSMGYMHKPDGPGHAALHRFIGSANVKTVLSIAGPKATITDFNLVIKNLDKFREAKAANSNAVLLWFKRHTQYPEQDIPFNPDADIIAEAKAFFISALKQIQEDEDPDLLWESASALNNRAVAQYLNTPQEIAGMAINAYRAEASPSFTAIRTLSESNWETYGDASRELKYAFIRESELRVRSRGKSQNQLATQYRSIEHPYYKDPSTGNLITTKTEVIEPLLRDLIASRNQNTHLSWQEVLDTIPKELIREPKPKRRRSQKPRAEPPKPLTREELESILDGPAQNVVEEALTNAITIKVNPGISVEIREDGNPEPVLKVWKNSDGAIHCQSQDYFIHGPLPEPSNPSETGTNWTTRGLKTATATRIVTKYIQDNWGQLVQKPNVRPLTQERVSSHLHARLHHPNGHTVHSTDEQLSDELAQAVASLVDPSTYSLLRRVSTNSGLEHYNLVAKATTVIRDLERTNPGVVTWAMTTDELPSNPPKHPGELVALVKNTLIQAGLEPKNWRTVSTLDPEIIKEINAPNHDYRISRAENSVQHKALVLNTIAAAHMTPTPQAVREAILTAPSLMRYNSPDILSPLSRQNTQAFLTLMVKHTDTGDKEDITTPRDYLHHLNANATPITSTTWKGLCKAAHRWHRDIQKTNIINRWNSIINDQQGFYRAWTSALQKHHDEDYVITPLSSEYDLFQESLHMEHCVIGYGYDCAAAQSRIFSMETKDGKRVATTELNPKGPNWAAVQTRGWRNHPVSTEIEKAASRLAQRYQNAQQKDEKSCWWVNVDTAEAFEQHPSIPELNEDRQNGYH